MRITLLTLALIACLCVYECHGRKQRPVVADSLVSEDTALVQPHDSAPDETSGVAPGEKKQPLISSSPAAGSSIPDSSVTTKAPKGKNGKRGKNGNGGGKKVKKNRNNNNNGNNQQPSNGSSGEGKRKNKNKSSTGSDVTLSTSRGKKNKNQGRTTSSVPSADTTVE